MKYALIDKKTNMVRNVYIWEEGHKWIKPPSEQYKIVGFSAHGMLGDYYDEKRRVYLRPGMDK